MVQPDFPPERIGEIMSAYYGGRAEIHIRRQIVPVIHSDFMSMYPTVCTLMGLWKFVCSQGIETEDCEDDIRTLLQSSPKELVDQLRLKSSWGRLLCLVQVLPNHDLFPVRAKYPGGDVENIGLNYLTNAVPQWFTLADVLVSKILTGKTPEIIAATRFCPKAMQKGLKSIVVAGERIDPATDDFYRRLIVHRISLKAKSKHANEAEARTLESDALATKILANSTSYGIFVELNVKDLGDSKKDRETAKNAICYAGQGRAFKFNAKKIEEPGAYFHPLLATLITGAARLMLALAEYQVVQQGLDWAFCDTDSLAIANTHSLPVKTFKAKALQVVEWFKDLNPYGEERSILQLEKVNFPPGKDGVLTALDPPLCLTVSAKRYALFNKLDGNIIIRKASGHGLGHLMAPYDEPAADRRARTEKIGVPLWQEDLWKEIIRAAESETPDQTRFSDMPAFDTPAASQYAATTPTLLGWFKDYNLLHPDERIFPFGFLLSLQSKSRVEMQIEDSDALAHELWRRREPRPAAPYFKSPSTARKHAFDRARGSKIPAPWLKSLGRSLARYHLHPETKFSGGDYDQRGALQRRHVQAIGIHPIGKEADNIGENEFIGEDAGPLEYSLIHDDYREATTFVTNMQSQYRISDRTLVDRARVSFRTLSALKSGEPIAKSSLNTLTRAVDGLRQEIDSSAIERDQYLRQLKALADKIGGRNKLAKVLEMNASYIGRVLRGEKPVSDSLIAKLNALEQKSGP